MDFKKIIFSLLPKVWLSRMFGLLVALKPPAAINRFIIEWFAKKYCVNLHEAAGSLDDFDSLSAFFVRDLKPGVRPIGRGVVSPVDGVLRSAGEIGAEIEQVKGKTYRVAELLDDPPLAESLLGGQYSNLYLSPRDYHHVHSPFSGALVQVRRLAGALWPVNDWAVNAVDNLFVRNARVIFVFETGHGAAVLVMVGAYNVGDMRIQAESEPLPRGVEKGARIGTFMLGSSVVLLLPKGFPPLTVPPDSAVLYGQSL